MTDMNDNGNALLERAGELPRSMAPERDLWAGIEAQLGEQLPAEQPAADSTGGGGGRIPGPNPYRWQAPALAASLLLALVAGYWLGQTESPASRPVAVVPTVAQTGLQAVSLTEEVGLKEARRTMAREIEAGLARLPDDARQVVIENLTTINNALDEIDAVLAQTPASGLDRQLLISMYTDQLARLNSMQALVMNSNQEILL